MSSAELVDVFGTPVSTLTQPILNSWMTTLVDYVRSGEPDLTNRQMALLMVVYLMPGPHTVRGLARALNVSKPVVTRALNRLGALGYLRRQRDDSDKRNIFIAPTNEGADFLEEFGNFIGDADGADAHSGGKLQPAAA
jgi:DNA-binding MarR family transcriptional regulator